MNFQSSHRSRRQAKKRIKEHCQAQTSSQDMARTQKRIQNHMSRSILPPSQLVASYFQKLAGSSSVGNTKLPVELLKSHANGTSDELISAMSASIILAMAIQTTEQSNSESRHHRREWSAMAWRAQVGVVHRRKYDVATETFAA